MFTVQRPLARSQRRWLITAGGLALSSLFSSALCAAPPSAHAAPPAARAKPPAAPGAPSPSERSRVQALKERSRDAVQMDELPESLAALRGLQALDSSVATACNLGLVARRLGSSVEAAENLSRCVMAYGLVPTSSDDRARVEEIAGELAMARAAIAVVSLTSPPGAEVTIDGQAMGPASADREYFLEPGWHTFTVTKGLYTSHEEVNLARGSVRSIQLSPAPPPPATPRRNPWPVVGWVLSASAATAGVVMLAASEINHDIAVDNLVEAKKTPGACFHSEIDPIHCSTFAESRALAGSFRDAAIGSFAVAGAMALGTSIYMIHGSGSSPQIAIGSNFVKVVALW